MRCSLLAVPLVMMLALAGRPASAQTPPVAPMPPAAEPLRTAGDRSVDVRHLKVEVKVDLPGKAVDGRATLSIKANRKLNLVTLDAEGFEVKSVTFATPGGTAAPAKFTHDKLQLIVSFEPPLATGAAGDLTVEYKVRNPKRGLNFFAPTKSEPHVPLTVWSQGESIETRHWIPCFDRPGIRQSTELIATVAEGNEVLSNGKLLSKKADPAAKTVTFHWRQDEPHPAYLITMAVGPFAIVEDRWRDKPVLYYVPPSRKNDARRTFGRTPEMMEVFSKKFGVDYAWDKYAQVVAEQFGGGMENTSATTLGDCLVDERASLDEDADGLVSHELGHQWWGDLVTCRDWAHLWLNEGFASYCECIWAEHRHGPDAYSLDIWHKSRAARGSPDRPVVDRRYPTPDSMFDSRAYPKGAFIIHMLRQRLGDEIFEAGLKRFLTEHRFKSVETVDLRRAFEHVSGQDLEKFFYDWTERPGHPKLDVSVSYDVAAKRVRVAVKQTQAGEPFRFPLAVRLTGTDKNHAVTEELIDSKEHVFQIPATTRPLGIEIDPAQAVLAEVKEEKGRDWWAWQLVNGSSAWSRVAAAEHFGKSKTPEDRELLIGALTAEKTAGVATEIMSALAGSGGDVCRDALIATLKHTDPKRRRNAVDSLNRFGKDEKIADAIRALLVAGDPSTGVESAALMVYARQKRPDAVKLISAWLDKDSNHDRLRFNALSALAVTQDPAAGEYLLSWASFGKPFSCRTRAIASLAQWTKETKPAEAVVENSVKLITEVLGEDSVRLRREAINALTQIGPAAKSALPRLDEIASKDAGDGLADTAKNAAKVIRTPVEAPEIKQLKEQLDRLRKEHDELRQKLEALEKKAKN